MYGLRPSTSGVYGNDVRAWKTKTLQDRVTLSRHFAANGYKTYTAGKIYHGGAGLPPNDFDVVGPRPGQRLKTDKRLVPPEKGGAGGLWDFGAQSYPEEEFPDHQTTTWAIDIINQESSQPFFLALGYYRPHVPLYSPIRVFNQIPYDEIDLPIVKVDDRADLPSIVDLVTIPPVAPKHDWFVRSGRWKECVQSYLACIRFTDEMVGRLIKAIDASPHADNHDRRVVLGSRVLLRRETTLGQAITMGTSHTRSDDLRRSQSAEWAQGSRAHGVAFDLSYVDRTLWPFYAR